MKMPFGKHKGEELSEIPVDYLAWIEENYNLSDELREGINEEIKFRNDPRTSKGRDTGRKF